MSSPRKPCSLLPPIRRDYQGSRLEARLLVSAYECVVPVTRRPLNGPRGPVHALGCHGAPQVAQKAI
jgi:hypothetical protein